MPDELSLLQHALEGRYRVDRLIGEGGMARVFLAHDLKHDRPVALKVLRSELASALGPERFEREIRLAARLQHPHILTVLDSGEARDGRDSLLWFTMPFVEGESLRERLQRERQLSLRDAVRIVREAAQALQYAHEHGVIHRDIKPDNIMLTKDGSTLVADFGIARALGSDAAKPLTQTGMTIGTPDYMSPEQAGGERDVDARTDVYSLGVVLYELLAGEVPFTGPSVQSIIAKRLTTAPPSVRATRSNVPEAIDRAIQRSLAVVAGDRFPTAGALAEALESAPTDSVTTARPSAPAGARAPVAAGSRGRYAVIQALVIGLAIGGGVLFAWRRSTTQAPAVAVSSGAMRLAVLPFENLGDSSDAYFADGVTDAVRGKLTSLASLQVIARGSSVQYRSTSKTPPQIAQELGVRYLLTGTVRWARQGGSSRVQVSPELVEIGADGAAQSRWQQPFDAPMTDVFALQASIADQVARAMRLALPGATEAARAPTENPAAYDAWLRGQAAWGAGANIAPPPMRRALAQFHEAARLDSTFAAAWAGIVITNSLLYANAAPEPAFSRDARLAIARLERLDQDGVDTHVAKGRFAQLITSDFPRALAELQAALAKSPNDAAILAVLGGVERSLGRWDEAVTHAQAAYALDPRSALRATQVTGAYLWLRRSADARATADRAMALGPSLAQSVQRRVMVELQLGNLSEARRILAAATDAPAADLAVFMSNVWDLYWVLDEPGQQFTLSLGPPAFDDDVGTMGTVRSEIYWLHGDTVNSRLWADTALKYLNRQLRAAPDDQQRTVFKGLALAYLGRRAEAVDAIHRSEALQRELPDAFTNPYFEHVAVRAYLALGDKAAALDLLEGIMRAPYFVTAAWLRIDPNFAPLRGEPRFERLIAGS